MLEDYRVRAVQTGQDPRAQDHPVPKYYMPGRVSSPAAFPLTDRVPAPSRPGPKTREAGTEADKGGAPLLNERMPRREGEWRA